MNIKFEAGGIYTVRVTYRLVDGSETDGMLRQMTAWADQIHSDGRVDLLVTYEDSGDPWVMELHPHRSGRYFDAETSYGEIEERTGTYVASTPGYDDLEILAKAYASVLNQRATLATALGDIRRVARVRDNAGGSVRAMAVQAVRDGAQKTKVAEAAGVSRPTLDSWLES